MQNSYREALIALLLINFELSCLEEPCEAE
jgi:hypothetical protein